MPRRSLRSALTPAHSDWASQRRRKNTHCRGQVEAMGSSSEHDPARRTWRREKDEPGKPNAPAQSHSGRKTTRPTSERSDIQGAWGALPTSSLGPRPPSTSGTSPRCAPAGGVPVTPPGATLLRPYGSSGRAPARTVAGDSPALGGSPGGGGAAPPLGAGRGDEAIPAARRGTRRVRPAVPRTGVTAGAASRVPAVPGKAWRVAPGTPAPVRPPAGARSLPAPAGECAW